MAAKKYNLLEMEQFDSRRDQFALLFGVCLVLLTVFLIIDIQVGLNITRNYDEMPLMPEDGEFEADVDKSDKQEELSTLL